MKKKTTNPHAEANTSLAKSSICMSDATRCDAMKSIKIYVPVKIYTFTYIYKFICTAPATVRQCTQAMLLSVVHGVYRVYKVYVHRLHIHIHRCVLIAFIFILQTLLQVSWVRHRDIHLLTVGRYTYTSDQRFKAIHHAHSEDWILQIKYPQHRDSGIYECQVMILLLLIRYDISVRMSVRIYSCKC